MYECVVVEPYRAEHDILYAEGPVDNEMDADDDDIEELISPRRVHSVTSSTGGTHGSSPRGTHVSWDSRGGSPMDVDE